MSHSQYKVKKGSVFRLSTVSQRKKVDMASYLNVILITVLFVNTACFAAPIVKSPRTQRTNPGEWAEFTCTVSCSYSIEWFVEGHTSPISETCEENSDGMILCKEVSQSCSSTTSTSGYVETLRLLPNPKLAPLSIAVQCAAISLSLPTGMECAPFLSFSRYALLIVRSPPTQHPALPSPSPTTPALCPTTYRAQDHTTPDLDPVTISGNRELEDY